MSKLLKKLNSKEIESAAELGKGCNYYYLALCGAGYDSGTCDSVFRNCGYRPSKPRTGCKSGAGCTCR
ncbi:glycocin F family RiPP peptide [Macrococcus animalis]|uniref:glycocin F family RiPP peptide n=1 Tax=Macrococcus animalis TaxID=3395467 RepID=UPI0039BDE518